MADTKEKDDKIIEDFNWDNPNGLRYVSDEMLEACIMLYDKTELSLKFINASPAVSLKADDGNQNGKPPKHIVKVSLSNNIESLCNYKYTVQDLLNALKSDDLKFEDGKKVFSDKKKDFTYNVINTERNYPDYQIESICTGCKFEKCPKA